MKTRFTIDGSDTLENQLTRTCNRVATGVRELIPNARLEALLLGGGYGRGHGGVLKTDDGDKPYNDLEFYVCIRGNELWNQRKYQRAFHELAEKLSPEAGIEVELKVSSIEKLSRNPPTMFAYDLVCGHQTFLGDDAGFTKEHVLHAENIPLSEATRLLMNRCTGLLFAKERLLQKPFTAEDGDFVSRNQAKAQLGFGDVFLAAHGKYHWDCRERNRRLEAFLPEHSLPWLNEVRQHHKCGVEFKLHPNRSDIPMENLCDQQRRLTHIALKVWLWLESKRLKQMFACARDYACSTLDKCPETNPIRNFFINANTFGLGFLNSGNPWRYPRERLFNSLALLLWEPDALSHSSLRLHPKIPTRQSFPELVRSYETLWKKFN